MGPFVHADAAYLAVLADNPTWQMSEWVKDKPFLSLCPGQKTEILAYLCNELLNNKVKVSLDSVPRRKTSNIPFNEDFIIQVLYASIHSTL